MNEQVGLRGKAKCFTGECSMAAKFGARSTTDDVLAAVDLEGKRIQNRKG
ncbi:MAG TPA: hypothetical protein VK638_42040 [Edaphobacter sp.]|nr:hypothetical protein [Edaphobacter sp.]